MFCAVPPNDVRVQEQCITAIMMRANVQHLDPAGPRVGNGKNMLVEKGDNGRTGRITLFDFDISSIDGFKGRKTEGLLCRLYRHLCHKTC